MKKLLKKQLTKKEIILSVIFIIYLVISFILSMTHEIWTDEAQAWEIAKNLSIPEIFAQMKYEAHPCLWHLILSIPAKLGLPVISMKVISLVLTSIAVYIILFHSKLNLFIKVIIVFNPTFIYYLSAVSRNYCLVILLLSIFSLLYDKRFKHPIIYTIIIGLLAHTHIIICGFVGIASLLFLIELIKKKEYKQFIISLLILFLFFVLLALQIFPSFKNCAFISLEPMTLKAFQNKILYSSQEIGNFFIKTSSKYLPIILLILILIVSTILTYINNKQKGIILLISILFFYIVHLYWPFGVNERTSIIFAIIVLLNLDNKKIEFTIFISILSIIIILTNIEYLSRDLINGYSDSKNVSSFINKNIPNNSLIIILDLDRHVSAIPYIYDSKNLTYYSIQNEAYQTFMTWDIDAFKEKEHYIIEKEIMEVSKGYQNVYILYGINMDNKYIENTIYNLSDKIISQIYKTEDDNYIERFSIYKYKAT